ncbi:Bug family tripartite tricarboxylate transporter substrate binding protein [Vandammella animalimorsus]|uniref:ABC transporter substrate-binding protein n=1 Tax=Vandammella animalimorsus TaxID=2029117 RepID=A0A2A2ARX0_9BURK|nr:tripartite tricarboxylate transporter substrate-binding protein [Vandammella animalimorsus]PAT40471.1 ABC transporter substrate-binding protein [Vandammella animalimorsus]
MTLSRRCFTRQLASALACCTLSLGAGQAMAEQTEYPEQPIELLVPFAAGGTTDIIARAIAEPLGKELGQPVLVVNIDGQGGIAGAQQIARSAADGYRLGIATVSSMASNPAIHPDVGYHPLNDFSPIIHIASAPNVLSVHSSFPAKSYAEFVKAVQAKPDGYRYASSGTGGIGHLQMELLQSLSGLAMQHAPYGGAGPALNSVVTGEVPILFDNLPSSLFSVTSGKLRPIAIAAPERIAALPQVPTFKELGLEPANRMAYYGIVGPKDLPRPIVYKIHAATAKVLSMANVRQRIEDTGAQVISGSPEEFAAQIKAEYEVYEELVKQRKLTLE